ncbi:MAG: hypothetical protein IJC59_04035 [Lachnospiraceae bacterium]|nr:hypothetical protein [Lachnospiraceae bacterium]
MMSKNLFLVSLRENLKRRVWVIFVTFLTLFLCFPGYLSLSLNSMKASLGNGYMQEDLLMFVYRSMGLTEGLMVLVVCLGSFAGLQAFAFLHQRKKVDFYHSQPLTRQFRFLVVYVNGILIFAGCYLFNLVLGMAVAAGYGCLTGTVFLQGMKSFLLFLPLFLCLYHFGILAVLMTGNIIIAVLALGTFHIYEVALRGLFVIYQETFFHTYSYRSSENWWHTLTSPVEIFTRISEITESFTYREDVYRTVPVNGESLLLLAALAAVSLGLIFALYLIRPDESSGRSLAFARTGEAIRILLLIPLSLGGGIAIYAASGASPVFGILGIAFTAVLCHMLLQIAFEFDLRSVVKRKFSLLLSAAAALLIFVIFRQDLMGYDDYIPDKEKVESVSLHFFIDNTNQSYTWIREDGWEISEEDYILEEMRLTDLDKVYALLEKRESYEEVEAYLMEYGSEDQQRVYSGLTAAYHLKNGKTEYRELRIDLKGAGRQIDDVWQLPEYRGATQQILSDNFLSSYKIEEISFYNGLRSFDLKAADFAAVTEAYCKDVRETSFTETYASRALGTLELHGEGLRNTNYTNRWEYVIYDCYRHTVEALEEAGIAYDNYIPGEISSIEVIHTDNEAAEAAMEAGEVVIWEEYKTYHSYTDPADIEAILAACIPQDGSHFSMQEQTERDYLVKMYCPAMYDRADIYHLEFLIGQIPEIAVLH